MGAGIGFGAEVTHWLAGPMLFANVNVLTMDEARRIAANIAMLLD